jgi:hypothetical protein
MRRASAHVLSTAAIETLRHLWREDMPITKIEVERFSVISSKRFNKVAEALKAAVGRPDMVRFAKATMGAQTFTELRSEIEKGLGRTGLMIFMELDLGGILRKESGQQSQDHALHHRESPDHEGNGQARSGRWLVRSGNGLG